MDPRVTEFHSIMPIENVASVMEHGILSYERAAKLPHRSVALQPIQETRDRKQVPGGLRLHQYANLYFHARNPMMFKRQSEVPSLCILRVSIDVLLTDGVAITDQNAASDWARFLAPQQWRLLDFDDIFAMDWQHPGDDRRRYWQHKSRKCAEVLVPHAVAPGHVTARLRGGASRRGTSVCHRLTTPGHRGPGTILPLKSRKVATCSRRSSETCSPAAHRLG